MGVWKTGEKLKQERPETIHHVSGCGGEGPISKYVRTKQKASFLLVKTSSFHHAKIWSPKLQWSARMDNPVRCFGSWAPPPLRLPRVHLMSFKWWMFPGRPCFSPVFRSRVLLWTQMEGKNGGGLETRLRLHCICVHFATIYYTHITQKLGLEPSVWVISQKVHDCSNKLGGWQANVECS